jgi:hypothetical protein
MVNEVCKIAQCVIYRRARRRVQTASCAMTARKNPDVSRAPGAKRCAASAH